MIKGVNGKFMPSEKVTRAQFALMLERAFENYTGKKYTASAKAPYADFGNYGAEAVNAISMLHELGITTALTANSCLASRHHVNKQRKLSPTSFIM